MEENGVGFDLDFFFFLFTASKWQKVQVAVSSATRKESNFFFFFFIRGEICDHVAIWQSTERERELSRTT